MYLLLQWYVVIQERQYVCIFVVIFFNEIFCGLEVATGGILDAKTNM